MLVEYKQTILWLKLLIVFLLFPSIAVAEIGPALSGLTASANDATSVFFSPAGITRLKRPEIVVQTAIAYQSSKFDVDDATFGGGDGDNDQEFFVIPGLFYAHPYSDRLSFGVSVNVPSGIGYDYGDSWSGPYHATETSLAFVAGTVVAAYKVTDNLS